MIGSFLRRVETAASIGSLEISRRMNGLPETYYREHLTRIQGITPDEVKSASATYIRPRAATLVAVGKAGDLQPQLASFGEVEVYDTGGNRIR